MIDYTLVVGVDARHLFQLSLVWPTWKKHKPSMLEHPMVVFYDREQVTRSDVSHVVDHPRLRTVPWPPLKVVYPDDLSLGRFGEGQRYKMLSGFLHVAANCVETGYWLKLDTDVVAIGMDDWIDGEWFENAPAIVAHPWGFTKPPDQMLQLDAWAERSGSSFPNPPLRLAPKLGWSRLRHRRIISWCGFFRSDFTVICSGTAYDSNAGRMPVPSQDGYMWYMARRMGLPVVRTNMKSRGWEHWSTDRNVVEAVARAMA